MRIAVLLIVFCVVCSGQVLVEIAAGALIGTAAGIGGKKISEEFDRAFAKMSNTLEKALREQKTVAPAPRKKGGLVAGPRVLAAAAPRGLAAAAPAGSPRRAGAAQKVNAPAPVAAELIPGSPLVLPSAVPTVPFAVTAEAFAQVKQGDTNRELIARLGSPTTKISMPEEGRVVEIYKYSSQGVELGSIRVVDGTVAEVKAAR